jgi:hypothetical protein
MKNAGYAAAGSLTGIQQIEHFHQYGISWVGYASAYRQVERHTETAGILKGSNCPAQVLSTKSISWICVAG